MLKKEFNAILKKYAKINSSNIDGFKEKLQIMIESSLFKGYFKTDELENLKSLINDIDLNNVEETKIKLRNDINKRYSDDNNKKNLNDNLKRNRYSNNNPYNGQ